MKRSFILLSLLFLLILTSCDFSAMLYEEVPFPTFAISPDAEEDEVTFLAISDVHLGAEKRATHFEELLFETLESKGRRYPFAIITGDLIDKPHMLAKGKDFISKLNRFASNNILYTPGNHEVHNADRDTWLKYDFGDLGHSLFSRYTYSGISIYKLDTGDRTLGKSQLRALERELERDPNEIKIFFSHVPISGCPLEATTYQLTLADADERNHLIALMKKHGVGIYLAGHHHKGNWAERYGSTSGLFILGSCYKRDLCGLDGEGWFYEITIDKTDRRLIIGRRRFEYLSKVYDPIIFDLP